MKKMIEQIKAGIAKAMAYRFPKYPIRFEAIEGEPHMLGVGVFAVPASDFEAVQDYVLDLEDDGCLLGDWELLPLVRDPEATLRYYPEMLMNWSEPVMVDIPSVLLGFEGVLPLKTASFPKTDFILGGINNSGVEWEYKPCITECDLQTGSSSPYFAKAA